MNNEIKSVVSKKTILYFVYILNNPQKNGLLGKPMNECFEEVKEFTCVDLLLEAIEKQHRRGFSLLIFHGVLEYEYGHLRGVDPKTGFIGYRLKYIG